VSTFVTAPWLTMRPASSNHTSSASAAAKELILLEIDAYSKSGSAPKISAKDIKRTFVDFSEE
jgi:hypothetical protein